MIRNIFKNFILSAFIGLLTVNVYANTTDLQLMLDNLMKTEEIESAYVSGIPLTAQYNHNNISTIAAGKISHDPNAKDLPVDAIFQVGSITKTFIGVLSVKLATAGYFGKDGLDNTVGNILGNQPSSDSWNSDWNKVKLRQLLNMTSGIPNYTDTNISMDMLIKYINNPYQQFSLNYLYSIVANKPIIFEPGEGYNYSNTNYIIMGEIISKVTHTSLQYQLNDKIIIPLHLEHTYYVDDIPTNAITKPEQKPLLMDGYFSNEVPEQFKTPYFYTNVNITGYTLSNSAAAGAIISNTKDINTFVQAIFNNNGTFLNANEVAELTDFVAIKDEGRYKAGQRIKHLDTIVNWGFGLGIAGSIVPEANGGFDTIYFKPGGTMGFDSQWIYKNSTRSSLVFTQNSLFNRCGIEMYIINQVFNTVINNCNLISDN